MKKVTSWRHNTATIFNTYLASSDFSHLLITFAKSLDQYQDPQNVGPDLDPNIFTL